MTGPSVQALIEEAGVIPEVQYECKLLNYFYFAIARLRLTGPIYFFRSRPYS